MNNRRRLVVALSASALASPFVSLAQQQTAKIPRIGIIDNTHMWDAFRQGLRDLNYVEGRNIAIEYRSVEGLPDRLAIAASELARLPVDIIVVFGTPAALAAKKATEIIPVVAIAIGDPVRAGLVASLARPGGNITGNSIVGADVGPKRLQLIKEVVPSLARVAFFWNPDNASSRFALEDLEVAAPKLGIELLVVPVRDFGDFDKAIATMMKGRPQAFLMTNDPLHQRHIPKILDALSRNRLPGMFQTKEPVIAGGLMSYGASVPELFRNGAQYVDKILKGAKALDLPIEQPTKFEFAINLKTAKALGLKIPQSILLQADRVIE